MGSNYMVYRHVLCEKRINWVPQVNLINGLTKTVNWYNFNYEKKNKLVDKIELISLDLKKRF